MATALPQARPWPSGGVPRWLLLGMLALVAVALAGGAFAYSRGLIGGQSAVPTYQTSTASRGTVSQTVSATGPITNPTSVPLTFKSSGKLAELDVAIGDKVTAGQVLARQDTTDLQI